MCNVIFLDIDGVLNSEKSAIQLDPKLINKIYNLCKENNIGIVISSSWRGLSLEGTKRDFNNYDELTCLTEFIVGITHRLDKINCIRGEEIDYFIRHRNDIPDARYNNYYDFNFFKHSKRNFNYVIVDDDMDMLDNQMNNFVHVCSHTGVTDINIRNIKEILNK